MRLEILTARDLREREVIGGGVGSRDLAELQRFVMPWTPGTVLSSCHLWWEASVALNESSLCVVGEGVHAYSTRRCHSGCRNEHRHHAGAAI